MNRDSTIPAAVRLVHSLLELELKTIDVCLQHVDEHLDQVWLAIEIPKLIIVKTTMISHITHISIRVVYATVSTETVDFVDLIFFHVKLIIIRAIQCRHMKTF